MAKVGIARVVSIQIGLPVHYEAEANGMASDHQEWYSAIVKQPALGPHYVRSNNIDGDRQADLKNHGGPDKAVLCYAARHYLAWGMELNGGFPYGGFGENFTIEELDETSVCIGDVLQVGEAKFQVSQMRGPCWKISRRWNIPDLLDRVKATGRTGWYLRVLREGYVEPGQPIELLERTHPKWTIARVNDVCERRLLASDEIKELLEVKELSLAARNIVEVRLRTVESNL